MTKNNKIFSFLLIALTIICGFILIKIINVPIKPDNQTSSQSLKTINDVPKPTHLADSNVQAELIPAEIEVNTNELIKVEFKLNSLKTPIISIDLLLNYDPTLLEFINLESLNPLFINPRKLTNGSELIVSLVERSTQNQTLPELEIATLIFKALKPGETFIKPIFNETEKSSMVIEASNSKNILNEINPVQVVIK